MKRITLFFCLLLCCLTWHLYTSQKERWLSPSGIVIEAQYRALQPGEIIVFSIKNNTVKDAQILFLGRKVLLARNQKRGQLMTFCGLDLSLKSGLYPIKIYIQGMDGRWEVLEKQLPITQRVFPEKRLWVEEKYVTPPPEIRERIRREQEILRSLFGRFTSEWLGEKSFIIPAAGKIFENFGERRIYNTKPRSPHGGIDISAPLGTPVKASNSGEVVLASDLYFSGNTVIIDHGLGLFSLYSHLSEIRVKRGQMVIRGEIIGMVGASGRVTGPHLHWGIKVHESRIDPFSLLDLSFD